MWIHIFDIDVSFFSESFWDLIGFLIGMSFITLSGYVNALGYRDRSFRESIKRGFKRAWYLALLATLISLVTYTFFYEQRISWGIIHFFALASLIQPLFSKSSWWIFPSIATIFLFNYFLSHVTVEPWYFIPFWVYPSSYFSADYYPLLPWFGYILVGQGLQLLFSNFWLETSLAGLKFPKFTLLRTIGKHSLLVYVLHTPVLYVLFSFIFWILS
jgi:uncharacterized membrane protein